MRCDPGHVKIKNVRCGRHGFVICIFYLLLFFVALSLSCRQKAPVESDVNAPAVVVTVNGVDITEDDVEALVKPELEKMTAKVQQLPPELVKQYKSQLRQLVRDKLVTEQLLDERVEQANIVVTEEDVITQLKENGSLQQPPLSLEEIQKIIEARGENFDEYVRHIQTSKEMKYQKFMETQWAGKINVTEDDARKYYSENPNEFKISEQVRASHILIKPDASTDADPNEAKAKAKVKAQNLLKQIREEADFAELAKANSDCPSGADGGDLDFFGRGIMAAPFEKAAFALKPGQMSDIVETRFGYHIIKVTDRKGASVVTFEQAKINIINKLKQEKEIEFVKEYIQALKEKADIVYPISKEPEPEPDNAALPSQPGSK